MREVSARAVIERIEYVLGNGAGAYRFGRRAERANSRASLRSLLAPHRSARRRPPVLRCFISFGVAMKRHLEIAEGDDEAGPAVDESDLENIVLQDAQNAVAERAHHRDARMRELLDVPSDE